jgi:RND superfamily putative drug exporter
VERTLRETFPDQPVDAMVVYSSERWTVDDREFRDRVAAAVAATREHDGVLVRSYFESPSPALVSEDGHAMRILVTLPGEDEADRLETYREIEPDLTVSGLETHKGGLFAVFVDVNDQVSEDIARAESIALPIVFVLSLLIFGSLAAALMPTLVGTVAVFGAFAVVRVITTVTDVSVFAINVITLMGMGLAIDYALFVVSRFREEYAAVANSGQRPTREDLARAMATTMATAGRTVFFSGIIVAASLSSLMLFPQTFLKSMGYGVMASLTVLPAMLAALGHRIEWGRLKRGAAGRHTQRRDRWARIARAVMRRPFAVLVPIVVGLIVLAAPLLGARWGGVDVHVLPEDAPSLVAADFTDAHFGGEQASALIVATGGGTEVSELATSIEAVPAISSAVILSQATDNGEPVTLLQATWPGNSQSEESQEVVRELRRLDTGPAPALVGGAAADTVDLIDSIFDTLPSMAGLVAAIMFVLLFIAFGSVVLPLKAIVMNTLSIGASFGAVTWVFQEGHFSDVLGFTSQGFLDVTQPILMLAVLFGLSMDYEVFLLSRVREEWDRSHDNTHSVASGLQHTGRIITSAALLLAVVIGGFSTSGIVFIKMLGVGMLVAVLLDATVVRALLVPATMRLLGGLNWWAPGLLRRWWERYGHHEYAAATAALHSEVSHSES